MTATKPRKFEPSTLATLLCFVVPLSLYTATAARTVQGGDTGEFGVVGLLGGVAHPPGYPLFTILLRIAGAIPLGAPFLRVALVSALCGAAAVAVLQRALWRMTNSLVASAGAALIFAASQEQWRLSGVPEVFTLNALAAAVTLLLAQRLSGTHDTHLTRASFWLGLAGGLGVSNHHTIIWTAPIVLWPLVVHVRRLGWGVLPKLLGPIALGGVLGLTPYLLLPVFAKNASAGAIVWGPVDSADGLLGHFLRRTYGTFRLGASSGSEERFHLAPVVAFFESFGHDFVYFGVALAVLGVIWAWKQRWPWALPVLLSFLCAGVLFTSLFNLPFDPLGRAIQARFYVLPELFATPFIAAGLVAIQRWNARVAPIAAGGLVLLLLLANGAKVNWRDDSFIERSYVAALRGAAPNAIIVGRGDTALWASRWAGYVLHERPDVRYLHAMAPPFLLRQLIPRDAPDLTPESFAPRQLPQTLIASAAKRPTYLTRSLGELGDLLKVVPTVPEGLLLRVVPPGTPPPSPPEREQQLLNAMTVIGEQPLEPMDQENAYDRVTLAQQWMELAQQYATRNDLASAERCRARALYLTPEDQLSAAR